MATGLAEFFQFNLWTNLRLLDVCEGLSEAQLDTTMGGTFGSVRDTLQHMLTSEEGYTRRLTGRDPKPALTDLTNFPGFDELRQRATGSGEALIAYAERVEEVELRQVLHLDEGTYDAPTIIVVMQAVQHGIAHRSQVATLLTQQGIEPPDLDTWAYNDATFPSQPSAQVQ